MKKLNLSKLIIIVLSMVLCFSLISLPLNVLAESKETESFTEPTLDFENQLLKENIYITYENENEKKYTIPENNYVYHEKYAIINNKRIAQVTVYSSDGKSIVDYYEQALDGTNPTITSKCGPPCGFIAVLAFRTMVGQFAKYNLKKSVNSLTLKTIDQLAESTGKARVDNLLRNYTPHTFKVKNQDITIRKTDMHHFMSRHHSNYYYNEKFVPNQTFFVDTMTPQTLKHIASQAVQRNANAIYSSPRIFVQSEYTYNGITYVVGLDKSVNAITQVYPKVTYILP